MLVNRRILADFEQLVIFSKIDANLSFLGFSLVCGLNYVLLTPYFPLYGGHVNVPRFNRL